MKNLIDITAEELDSHIETFPSGPGMIYVRISAGELVSAASKLKNKRWRFCLLTVWDALALRSSEYIFYNDESGRYAALRIDHEKNEKLPSISRCFPFCGLQEKEASELFGVTYEEPEYVSSACLTREYRGKPSPMAKKG